MAKIGLKKSLVVLAGARGVGKTHAASTYEPPSRVSRVFYHDGERSTNRIASELERQGLGFGYLNNLDEHWCKLGLPADADLLDRISRGKLPWATTKEKTSLIDFWHYITDDINRNLTPGKYSTYVHDPVERLESAMAAWVDNYATESGWSRRGYGGMWNEGYYPLYRGLMEAIYARGVDVIIFTAHLGNQWEGRGESAKIIPGKVKIKAKPALFTLSQLYVWLVQNRSNPDKAPAGVILKERLESLNANIDSDTWNPSPGLPRRIPHFTWDDVQRYIENGFDVANPAPGEELSEQEAQMIDDTFFSSEQMKLMLLWAKTDLAQIAASTPSLLSDDGDVSVNLKPDSLARELYAAGVTVEQISAQLGKPIIAVKKWIGEE